MYIHIFFARCITFRDWGLHNDEIIMTTMKEMNSTKVLRYYIDDILKEIVGDLNEQKKKTDESFNKRIIETKEIKAELETQHCEVNNNLLIYDIIIILFK